MRAVIYARFSSHLQSETSVEAQVQACEEYAHKNGISIINTFIDRAVSGKNTNRTAYQHMLRDAKNKRFDLILIHKYDRIARNLGDHINLNAKLQEYDIKLIAVAQNFGSGKEAKLMTSMQWILSEYYEDNLAEETRKGHKMLAQKGLHNGGVAPFGYDIVDKKYVVNQTEAPYVKALFQAALARKGFADVLREMNEKGITGKRGKPIRQSSVYEILRNEKYTGVYVYSEVEEKDREKRRTKPNAIRVEGAIPQLVERDVWEEVQKIMDSRKLTNKPKRYKASGLVVCGKCGAKMYPQTNHSSGHTYSWYICSNHCGQTVKAELIDQTVDLFIKETFTDSFKKILLKRAKEYAKDEERMLREFEETRIEKLSEKQKEIDTLTGNMAKMDMTPDVSKILNEKLDSLHKELQKIEALQPVRDYSAELINGWLDSVTNATNEELPSVLIDSIIYKDDSAEVFSTLRKVVGNGGCGGRATNTLQICTYKRYEFK